MNSKATSLNPREELAGKKNFKRLMLIHQDGTATDRILLSVVDPSLREMIICKQFISRYVMLFVRARVAVKYISRDKPWDLEAFLSTGETLKLEITAIAENDEVFRKFRYEEIIAAGSESEKIRFRELLKLNSAIQDETCEELVKALKEQGVSKDEMVPNPFYRKTNLFISNLPTELPDFDRILATAIGKKEGKNHSGKEDVILIIDNRTLSFTMEDVLSKLDSIRDYVESLPFKEVWIYTGYYSDDDGNNAEYSLCPVKLSIEKARLIEEALETDRRAHQ